MPNQDLIAKAVDKIDKEAENIKSNYAKIICQHIIDVYLDNDENAQKVQDKSLKDCLSDVESKVRKMASGNCAVVEDSTVYDWVKDFYGFAEEEQPENKIIDLFDSL